MEAKLTIQIKQLSKEELRLLIQTIRDCEQKSFPDKIFIFIIDPELTTEETKEIWTSIKPPYKSEWGLNFLFKVKRTESKMTIDSEKLSKEELRLLIQTIRDCEQKSFPDKIFISINIPELTKDEADEILMSIKPPYKYRLGL